MENNKTKPFIFQLQNSKPTIPRDIVMLRISKTLENTQSINRTLSRLMVKFKQNRIHIANSNYNQTYNQQESKVMT